MSTILITGGHHNSALVVAKELLSRGHQVAWVGHRQSSRGDTKDSAEYKEVKLAKIPFTNLVAGRLSFAWRELLLLPLGVFNANSAISKIKPDAILSFGGYLGAAVSVAGALRGIPIFLHEQTVTAGRANKLTARFAQVVYLTWKKSAKHFPGGKTKFVGLPLRSKILNPPKKSLFTRRKPLLLIMGGKQGAHVINQFVFANLHSLLQDFNLVHQTGFTSQTNDYQTATGLKANLGSLADCYLPYGYLEEESLAPILGSATFYFGRSGAHICYELGVLGLPSLLVPLMSTHDQEQKKNADILVEGKLALVLPESALTHRQFATSYARLRQLKGTPLSLPQNASQSLVDDLLAHLV